MVETVFININMFIWPLNYQLLLQFVCIAPNCDKHTLKLLYIFNW